MTLRGAFIPERNIALFLDVDGTLLEIAPTPDAVRVPAGLRNTLQLAAARNAGALALISGRALSDLDRLFAPCVFPAAGQHGLERRDARGRVTRPNVDTSALITPRAALASLADKHKGLLLEDKGSGLAIHYRLAPRLANVVKDAMRALVIPLQDRFVLREGKFVLELVPRGHSKRSAIEAFMNERPFARRTPVFIGDDLSDEEGFEGVNELGGCSIRVGKAAATAARHSFGSVAAVVAWLRERNLNLYLSGVQR